MKVKVIAAIEPEDSMTFRVTPKSIGTLLGKIRPQDFAEVHNGLYQELKYRTKENRVSHVKALRQLIDYLETGIIDC